MTDTEQTKVCPLCAETIKAAAKVCPHCRHWQTRPILGNIQVLQSIVGAILGVCVILAIFGLGIFLNHLVGPKRSFAPYQQRVKVVSSEISFQISNSNRMVSVVGVITNQTEFAWKNIGLEAQMFNQAGQLIDVIQVGDPSYSGVVVMPHAEAAFKISSKATHPESDYASHKVAVGSGKDFQVWP